MSARPEADIPALYRQMVFNAVIGNTDDHLKNFALRREVAGWRLTPAFDLLPDVAGRGEHCLHFGPAGYRPDAGAVQTLAGAFGVSRQRSRGLVAEVVAAVSGWRGRFAARELDLLVATTLIEVGVDVPNASPRGRRPGPDSADLEAVKGLLLL